MSQLIPIRGDLKDKLSFREDIMVKRDGQLLLNMDNVGKRHLQLIGEIECRDGLTGKTLFTFNDIIIPGATFILEKIFNRRSTYGMTTLSTDLAIKADVSPTQTNLKEELIFGFVLGIGGTEAPDLVKAVKFKDKTVATMVPLRMVDTTADLSTADQAKYCLKKTVSSKYYYYGKKFDTDVVIRHLYTDGTEIPPNVDQIETSLGLLVYGEAVFTVGALDVREYFMNTYGNIDTCRFNSLGLISGFADTTDYAGVRVDTKVNLPNLYLRDSESFYSFIYKIYSI